MSSGSSDATLQSLQIAYEALEDVRAVDLDPNQHEVVHDAWADLRDVKLDLVDEDTVTAEEMFDIDDADRHQIESKHGVMSVTAVSAVKEMMDSDEIGDAKFMVTFLSQLPESFTDGYLVDDIGLEETLAEIRRDVLTDYGFIEPSGHTETEGREYKKTPLGKAVTDLAQSGWYD